jgi:7-keto-8-aminopelargonate synthetase-like enzyme
MLDLFGTAYLGLQRSREYVEIAAEGMRRHGVANPFSRTSEYNFSPLVEAERLIADEFAQEDACLFTSGFLAGNAVGRLLRGLAIREGMALVVTSDIHPCLGLTEGPNRSSAPLQMSDLQPGKRQWIAAFEPLNSLLGATYRDLDAREVTTHAALLAIDTSHTAFLWSHARWRHPPSTGETLFYGSLAKGAAFPAGFVAGPRRLVDAIRLDAAYRTSHPPANALAFAFVAAAHLRRARLLKLRSLLGLVDEAFALKRDECWFPVYFLSDTEDTYRSFLCDEVRLSCVRYPSPASSPMVRAVIHAGLERADVERFIALCERKQVRPSVLEPRAAWRTVAVPAHPAEQS